MSRNQLKSGISPLFCPSGERGDKFVMSSQWTMSPYHELSLTLAITIPPGVIRAGLWPLKIVLLATILMCDICSSAVLSLWCRYCHYDVGVVTASLSVDMRWSWPYPGVLAASGQARRDVFIIITRITALHAPYTAPITDIRDTRQNCEY